MHTPFPLIKGYVLVSLLSLGGLTWLATPSLRAQSTQEVFGKNRIQHTQFDWKLITTTNYEIYYYQGGNDAAYLTAHYAESDFDRIADMLGYTPYSKTKIFLYNSPADLQQSNVGVSNEDIFMGGETSFIKSQVEIPFNGNQVAFKRDLSNSITQVFISEMMFGGSLKDMLQSSLLLSLPDWFMSGASAYVASGWSLEMDDYMRDAFLNKNVKKPSAITGERATLVGQSIWNYIAERYGKSNISNILNLTRIIRNEETSIASTLGIPFSRFVREWRQYYTDMATETAGSYVVPNFDFKTRKSNRRGFIYNKVAISPDGRYLAYSENRKGIYQVMVINTQTRRKKTIYRGGSRVINQRIDKQIPLLAWQGNTSLAIIAVEQASNKFFIYDTEKVRRKVKKTLDQFIEILDFDVSDDGSTLVLSAEQNGQGDLFTFNIARNTTKRLTNDLYDDLQPSFMVGSSTDVVFSSNRQTDSLNANKADFRSIQDNYSLYLYNASASSGTAQKLVSSAGNITHPVPSDERTIFYLNDEKGIRNLYRYNLDTRTTQQVTSFRQNIREYDLNRGKQFLAYHTISDNREFVGFIKNFDFDQKTNTGFTKRNAGQEERSQQIKSLEMDQAGNLSDNMSLNQGGNRERATSSDLEPGEVDIDNYQFDSDLVKQEEKPAQAKTRTNILQSINKSSKKDNIAIRGPFPYQNRFTTNNVLSSLLINPITGWGIQFDVNMNDQLEDHVIKLGGLINVDLSSNNFYGEYRYLKKRIDYGIRFDRKQIYVSNEYLPQKYRLNQVMASASYPFSVSSRITVAPFYTGTHFSEVISFQQSSPINDASTHYVGGRIEYVYDNTIVNGMNMIEGTRMKIQYDNYVAPGSSNQSFDRLVVDLRNYQKIHRDIIFATRLSYGYSGGAARKRFLMGGMDNWLFNNQERPWPLPDADRIDKRDYFFLPFVTNLRGFNYNKLSGYNYLLFNAELRMPLVKYFYRGPIASNFLKNLQFVAFADVGTAWNQQSPFSRQNDLNTEVRETQSGPFRATVINFKNPFLSGYGLGVRTLLLGYYVKFDTAWGVENYVVGPARFYLTLGYDF
jgi:Tol biopolymer transport system component